MVLSLNVVAKMKLDFEQAMIALIALSVGVTVAAFLCFCYVAKMIRGSVEADHQGESFVGNHRQKRGEESRSTDWPASENLTNNSLLRQRPRPQENDEPFWQTVEIYFLT